MYAVYKLTFCHVWLCAMMHSFQQLVLCTDYQPPCPRPENFQPAKLLRQVTLKQFIMLVVVLCQMSPLHVNFATVTARNPEPLSGTLLEYSSNYCIIQFGILRITRIAVLQGRNISRHESACRVTSILSSAPVSVHLSILARIQIGLKSDSVSAQLQYS